MRRTFILGTLVMIGALSMTVAAFQQPAAGQPAPMVVEVDKLKDNLFVMKGGGGNSAVFIAADGVTVVDTKNPGWGQPLLDKIKTVTDKPVVRIINTHTHFDHTSGNVEFPAVEIVTQENTKGNMEAANPVYGLQTGPQRNLFKETGKGLPTRTFKDNLTIGRGADRIDLHYVGRAHTGGDAYVVFTALRVMHVGDTFANRDLPLIDKNNGGSAVDFAGTLAKAAKIGGVDAIINGHNPTTTTVADLQRQSEFVADFVAFVQAAKRGGKTVDDVVATWQTPAKYTGYAMPNPMRVRANAQVVWDETK